MFTFISTVAACVCVLARSKQNGVVDVTNQRKISIQSTALHDAFLLSLAAQTNPFPGGCVLPWHRCILRSNRGMGRSKPIYYCFVASHNFVGYVVFDLIFHFLSI